MSNATEMHFAAQLLAREFARGEIDLSENEEMEAHIRAVRLYCSAFLGGRPRNMEDRLTLAADINASVRSEMYGG